MAHVRKDTLVNKLGYASWRKHLRDAKRLVSKSERRAAKGEIMDALSEPDDSPKGLGLHNDPKHMELLKKTAGPTVIPFGYYCYDKTGNCPYIDNAANKDEQQSGFCWFLNKGDWEEDGTFLLWDQCKECGINDDDVPEGCFSAISEMTT